MSMYEWSDDAVVSKWCDKHEWYKIPYKQYLKGNKECPICKDNAEVQQMIKDGIVPIDEQI